MSVGELVVELLVFGVVAVLEPLGAAFLVPLILVRSTGLHRAIAKRLKLYADRAPRRIRLTMVNTDFELLGSVDEETSVSTRALAQLYICCDCDCSMFEPY